jgi:hypothetical protein
VRLWLLLVTAFLGLTGCATIKGWFAPETPPARAEQPDESSRREARPPAPVAPRAEPPAPAPPSAPAPPRPATPAPVAPRAAPPAPAPPRPATPAASPPAPVAPPAPADVPPPVLSPVLSAADEQKLRGETQQRIDGAEQRLRQIDPAKLASGQQDSLQTVQSFLGKAREALQAQDVQRAFTLADKAYLLADELTTGPR